MSTDATTGKDPAPRIVRIGIVLAPLLAAGAVLASTGLGVSRQAWAPLGAPAAPDAWQQPLPSIAGASASLQVALGTLGWPADPIAGSIAAAAGLGAMVAAGMVVVLRRAGLGAGPSLLLSLVSASAPFALWQATSPLGLLPLTLASLGSLAWTTAPTRRWDVLPRWGVGLLAVVALAVAVVGEDGRSLARLVRAELGLLGLVLLLVNLLVRRATGSTAAGRVIVGATSVLVALTAWFPATAVLALLLPWLWWGVGTGLAGVLDVRGAGAGRWAMAGLACWLVLHVGQAPWGQRRQAAAAARTWADGLVAAVSASRPLVLDTSARGHLAAALVGASVGREALIDEDDLRAQTGAGRTPVVTDAATRDRWRASGVAFAAAGSAAGSTLHDVLDAFPRGTVVLVGISRDAATRLTAADWQALSRVGLRSADAGQPRAHVLAGATQARVAGRHHASADQARLDVQPGDPLGRIGARSPLDARLEATATDVVLTVRGRRMPAAPGVLVTLWTTRGDLIAWRTGESPARLHGAVTGLGDATTVEATSVLPCVAVPAHAATDVTAPAQAGALTLVGADPARIEVRLALPEGATAGPFAWLDTTPRAATLRTLDQTAFVVERASSTEAVAVALRRRVTRATASASAPVRLCGMYPAATAIEPAARPLVVDMGPGDEVYLSDGWHDRESADGRHFRWTAGHQATLVVALGSPAPLEFALDAQTPDEPRLGDAIRLIVNDRVLPDRPVEMRRGRVAWTVPAQAWHQGLNTIVIESSRTVRPADRSPDADGRTLGLAIHGWSLRGAQADIE